MKCVYSLLYSWLFLILLCRYVKTKNNDQLTEKPWPGKWFPHKPQNEISNENTTKKNYDIVTVHSNEYKKVEWPENLFPNKQLNTDHRIPMGVYNPRCDNARIKLDVDWYNNPVNFTCLGIRLYYEPNVQIQPIYEIQEIPPMYKAAHFCMNETIEYDSNIPTFGAHRPLWAKWGEYIFLPKQRWLHNLEHGGIIMLYHPCANNLEVKKLRNIVASCLYRHVITSYNMLSPERPLALVAWGRKLEMSVVSKKVAVEFIKEAALHGAEHTSRDGQYVHGLISHAKIVSNEMDDNLCPNL